MPNIFSSDCKQILIFSTDFHRRPQHQISRKFALWERELLHADRRRAGHDEAYRRILRRCDRRLKLNNRPPFLSPTGVLIGYFPFYKN